MERDKKRFFYLLLMADFCQTFLQLVSIIVHRFKAADADSDGKLNKNEYADFLHPEETKSMRDIVIDVFIL
jgi:hypothetical protein